MINIALEGYETKIMFLKKWKMYESEYINKINYQFILTLKGCIYNEAKGNGSSTVKERISKVKEFRTNRDIREIIKKVDSKYLKINEKINYWILKYTNIQLLFFAYLLKSKIVYLVKRNLF